LKRNRIACPEVAVNGQICLENRIFFKLPEQIEISWKFACKKRIFVKLPEKSKFFGNMPGKIDFFTRSHDPPDFKLD